MSSNSQKQKMNLLRMLTIVRIYYSQQISEKPAKFKLEIFKKSLNVRHPSDGNMNTRAEDFLNECENHR